MKKENKKWRFLTKIENGKGSVGLQEISPGHPFYDLQGSNNAILLTTDRYKEYPMMIKGYGGGDKVTAAGINETILANMPVGKHFSTGSQSI